MKYRLIWTFAILLSGALYFLDLGMLPLWTDEIAWLRYSSVAVNNPEAFWSAPDAVHNPWMLYVFSLWYRFAETDGTLRMPSAAFAALALIAWLRAFAKMSGPRKPALTGEVAWKYEADSPGSFSEAVPYFSALLYGASSLALMYSRQMRWFSLASLLSALAILTYFSWRENRSRWKLALLFPICVLGFFVNLTFVYPFVFIFVHAFLSSTRKLRTALIASAFMIAAGGMYLLATDAGPLIFERLWTRAIEANDHSFAGSIFPWRVPYSFFLFTLGETVFPWTFIVTIPCALASLISATALIRAAFRQRGELARIVVAFLSAYGIYAAVGGHPKYFFAMAPVFILLLVVGAARVESRVIRLLVVVVLAVCATYSAANYFLVREYHNRGNIEPFRQVCDYVAREIPEGSVVVWPSEDFECLAYLHYRYDLDKRLRLIGFRIRENEWWDAGDSPETRMEVHSEDSFRAFIESVPDGRDVYIIVPRRGGLTASQRAMLAAPETISARVLELEETLRFGIDEDAREINSWTGANLPDERMVVHRFGRSGK
ncbi:MAG: hypothetical protein NUW37_00735 [Planctomycetes bacterium]|nr:hypothetical protein [Planctomycetota bacterium]